MFNTNNTTIVCIDLQQKLVNMLQNKDNIVQNAIKLIKAASILNVDMIISEQYPKGLGDTIDEIKVISDFKYIEKNTFSALSTPEFEQNFNAYNNKNVVIFGIETHICVYQTTLDLLDKGYNVYVVCDCCASRSEFNHNTALELMRQKGACITSLEIVLFDFLKSSRHPDFKEIQGLIKSST